jgi:predicted AlkP superfamily phosphohydrolase/phosphomutase
MKFPSFKDLKSEPFWLKKKSVIVNVPATYPVSEMKGVIISGFVSPDLERAVYPREIYNTLKNMDYEIDVDSSKVYDDKSLFLHLLNESLQKRLEVCSTLWDHVRWQVFMVVFTGTDRIGHFLWDAYKDERHKHHKEFIDYFKKVDRAVGNIMDSMNPHDLLVICSDHGMESIKVNVNINTYLEEQGYLKIDGNRLIDMQYGTQAFALDPSRIYLNDKDRFRLGTDLDRDDVLYKLIDVFDRLEYKGEKVIKGMYLRDQIYHGKCIDSAPDLVLLPNEGFSLRGSLGKPEVFYQDDKLTGKHTQHDAFLLVNRKSEKIPDTPSVEDIVQIMEDLK